MAPTERLAFLRSTAEQHRLNHSDLSRYTGYSLNTVVGWFTDCQSTRYRDVPARAVDRLRLELSSGNVKGSK